MNVYLFEHQLDQYVWKDTLSFYIIVVLVLYLLVLFKYISYESGHFNLESMFIWKYVGDLLQKDSEIPNILKDNLGLISDAESEAD